MVLSSHLCMSHGLGIASSHRAALEELTGFSATPTSRVLLQLCNSEVWYYEHPYKVVALFNLRILPRESFLAI